MKHRLAAILLCTVMGLSLCSCSPSPAEKGYLNGKPTEYSETIAYAAESWGGVEIIEAEAGHVLKNKTAQLAFGRQSNGLKALTSLQTGENLLQNTVETTLVTQDGKAGTLTGGTETIYRGNYGVNYSREDAAVKLPGNLADATVLKEFSLTGEGAQKAFSALKNEVSSQGTDTGLKVVSQGSVRAQFGARYLGIRLEEHDHYYLSITVRTENITGLKCYFATEETSLTEDTLLGTLNLSQENSDEFVTLTAEIQNPFWRGTLQTLLFRLPEGESGGVEISRIALLTLDDPEDEGVADTLWTVYSDRVYFSQTLQVKDVPYSACSTVISVPGAKCKDMVETEDFIALKMIDGSVLGFVRPASGATVRIQRDGDTVQVIFDWDLTGDIWTLALRMYVNYTEDLKDLEQTALEERTPLTAADFILEGAEFEAYDARGGIYRLTPTEKNPSVTVKGGNRTVYIYLPPAENTVWRICDKKGVRLPVFSGTTFPLCLGEKPLRVSLSPEPATETLSAPTFFSQSGLMELSRTATVLNGLCAQHTTVYASPDGAYTVTLTATRLKDGVGTIYDIQYTFHARKQVSDVGSAFPFFSFELGYGFDKYFYYNEENETVVLPAGSEEISYLGAMPFIGLSSEGQSAGWLVTKSQMTVGGNSSTAFLCLRYEEVSEDRPNCMYLSFDEGEIDFVRGDTLTAQVIRLDGEAVEEPALKDLRNRGNFQLIQTEHRSKGSFVTLGMEETVILRVEGFEEYQFPEIRANGEVFTPEYHVYVDKNGYYGFAFAVSAGTEIVIED